MRDIMGAVDGTRRNVDLLMETKQAIFVYPGGARETFKRTTDEKYCLIWGERKGFAQMAIRHGCTIVPVTNYGTEDMINVVGDIPLGESTGASCSHSALTNMCVHPQVGFPSRSCGVLIAPCH